MPRIRLRCALCGVILTDGDRHAEVVCLCLACWRRQMQRLANPPARDVGKPPPDK